ncbi:MAG: hypothetical protein ACR2HX_25090 [Pyrinomonadaceae bacterium]
MRPVNFHTDRIRTEGIAVHKCVGLFRTGAAVNLKLHPIPVRILVINGKRYAVMKRQ